MSRLWDLVKVVTAFTVAHTMTLILAALELVRLPTGLIETGIAVTIMYVALENLWTKETRHRWGLRGTRSGLSILIFLFGLAWFIERAFGLSLMPV